MKRAAPDLSEDKVLLRALRDFNLGKLTSDDTAIFVGLLNDLFPKTLELVPRAREPAFEARVREAAAELGYQPDEGFCLKAGQLRELFGVRWSVFLLGPAGCGKSAIWRTLLKAQNAAGEKTVYRPINPKAVTRNELYGFLHPQTREWREGLVSATFRDFSGNAARNAHQWIVLDGDIDAGALGPFLGGGRWRRLACLLPELLSQKTRSHTTPHHHRHHHLPTTAADSLPHRSLTAAHRSLFLQSGSSR